MNHKNFLLRAYLTEHSSAAGILDTTYLAVALTFGVTRQRVHQLAKTLNIRSYRPPANSRSATCADCGTGITPSYPSRHPQRCRACAGKQRAHPPITPITPTCDRCGTTFQLAGKQAATWRRMRKQRPELRTICPSCLTAHRRETMRKAEALLHGKEYPTMTSPTTPAPAPQRPTCPACGAGDIRFNSTAIVCRRCGATTPR